MKKALLILVVLFVLAGLYFAFVRLACITPYQKAYVLSKNASGVVFDSYECIYVGWKGR